MTNLKKGIFITFEGPEGSGKSTQAQKLAEVLKQQGYPVVLSREPGGTPVGQQIRNILLSADNTSLAHLAEVMLFAADRAQHLEEKVLPSLAQKKIVICDRYVDSTTAYQIGGRGLDPRIIRTLNELSCEGLLPERTYLLDIPEDEGLRRATRKGSDRFEKEVVAFHERVRAGYLRVARENKRRVRLFNGLDTIENIHRQVLKDTEALLRKYEV
jgi:dTMP kinase